jgi:rfaE bifunctional protein kinase chain/domain
MAIDKTYLESAKGKIKPFEIESFFDKFKNLKVLVIGDTIIDEYVFVHPKGRAVKDPILSAEYRSSESYAGGIMAIANHLSTFVKEVTLVTLIGDQKSRIEFIRNSIKENTTLKTFVKKDSPTTVKERMIDMFRNNKLFKIEYMNDKPIDASLTLEITTYLEKELPNYDLVLVGDFGHGFINNEIRRTLEKNSKFLSINVQSNSSNMGYNYFNLYKRFDFISMDEQELRLPLSLRFEDIDQVIREMNRTFGFDKFLVTRGKNGCILFNKGNFSRAPVLTESVKDTVGAGDALFAISSLFAYSKANDYILPFVANCAGGIAANIMGNKESVTRESLTKFMTEVLK